MITIKAIDATTLDKAKTVEQQLFQAPYLDVFFNQHTTVKGECIAAFDKDQCVGIAAMMFVDEHGELLMIGILPSHRLLGIGAAMMKHLIASCDDHGASKIFLEVRKSNQAAIRLYQKLGFVVNRIRLNYYEDTQEDALEMRLEW